MNPAASAATGLGDGLRVGPATAVAREWARGPRGVAGSRGGWPSTCREVDGRVALPREPDRRGRPSFRTAARFAFEQPTSDNGEWRDGRFVDAPLGLWVPMFSARGQLDFDSATDLASAWETHDHREGHPGIRERLEQVHRPEMGTDAFGGAGGEPLPALDADPSPGPGPIDVCATQGSGLGPPEPREDDERDERIEETAEPGPRPGLEMGPQAAKLLPSQVGARAGGSVRPVRTSRGGRPTRAAGRRGGRPPRVPGSSRSQRGPGPSGVRPASRGSSRAGRSPAWLSPPKCRGSRR